MSALPVFIGYDPREHVAAEVCRFSIEQNAQGPVAITMLNKRHLENAGIYTRKTKRDPETGQRYDVQDGRPFSTDFAFSRFLTPYLAGYTGPAIFMDSDIIVDVDICKLGEYVAKDPSKAVWVVQHDYRPEEGVKMDGMIQQTYNRKNWSSVMVFNCGHEMTQALTLDYVNSATGRALHTFEWLAHQYDKDPDQFIGELPPSYNFLVGWHDTKTTPPWIIHYTEGGPWFKGYENCPLAETWNTYYDRFSMKCEVDDDD